VALDLNRRVIDGEGNRGGRQRFGDLPALFVCQVLALEDLLDAVDELDGRVTGVGDRVAPIDAEELAGPLDGAKAPFVALTSPYADGSRLVGNPHAREHECYILVFSGREPRVAYKESASPDGHPAEAGGLSRFDRQYMNTRAARPCSHHGDPDSRCRTVLVEIDTVIKPCIWPLRISLLVLTLLSAITLISRMQMMAVFERLKSSV